jgi:hypothetical protein
LYSGDGATYQYAVIPAILMGVAAAMLLVWFWRLDRTEAGRSTAQSGSPWFQTMTAKLAVERETK